MNSYGHSYQLKNETILFWKPFGIKVPLNFIISSAKPTQEWSKHKSTIISTDLNVLEFLMYS